MTIFRKELFTSQTHQLSKYTYQLSSEDSLTVGILDQLFQCLQNLSEVKIAHKDDFPFEFVTPSSCDRRAQRSMRPEDASFNTSGKYSCKKR